jgi:imidazole glycerol-phosphate synthase subunit HisF
MFRIIPCLDIKNGRTVKGINFENLRDAGDPVELAKRYADEGADELVFLDISATEEQRKTLLPLVERIGEVINIPFTVGGGINSAALAREILLAGADKISVNSAAVRRPELLSEIAELFGNQCVVLAIDAKKVEHDWRVFVNGGKIATDWNLLDWAKKGVSLGAGELLFTSMNNDGTKQGFACDALAQLAKAVNVPIIASGGAGTMAHFEAAYFEGKASAALAASVFHFREIELLDLKNYLHQKNIPVRAN